MLICIQLVHNLNLLYYYRFLLNRAELKFTKHIQKSKYAFDV